MPDAKNKIMNLNKLTIQSAGRELATKKLSARELTENCLAEISERDGELGAFLEVDAEAR